MTAPNTSAAPALLGTTPGQLSSVLTLSGAAFGACASSALCRARGLLQRIVVDELRRAAFIGGQEGLPADFAFEFAALDCARERFADLSFEWRQLLGQFDAQIEKSAVDAFCMERRHSCDATCAWPKPVML